MTTNKTIYLTKYAQSRFGKLGNVTLEAMLREGKRKPAVLGTINYRFGDELHPSQFTTPEAPRVISDLNEEYGDRILLGAPMSHSTRPDRLS